MALLSCECRRVSVALPPQWCALILSAVCVSACVTPPGLWTALQGLEYGSSASQQALTEAVRRCVQTCLCSLFCKFIRFPVFPFFLNSFLSPLFRYSPGSTNKNSMLRRHVRLSGQCDVLSALSFPLCRRLSEEAPGGHRVRRQRLHQKDERWLWPSTHPYRRITAQMIEILFLSLLRCSWHLDSGWYTWLVVALY